MPFYAHLLCDRCAISLDELSHPKHVMLQYWDSVTHSFGYSIRDSINCLIRHRLPSTGLLFMHSPTKDLRISIQETKSPAVLRKVTLCVTALGLSCGA